jgi:hypothetical protein
MTRPPVQAALTSRPASGLHDQASAPGLDALQPNPQEASVYLGTSDRPPCFDSVSDTAPTEHPPGWRWRGHEARWLLQGDGRGLRQSDLPLVRSSALCEPERITIETRVRARCRRTYNMHLRPQSTLVGGRDRPSVSASVSVCGQPSQCACIRPFASKLRRLGQRGGDHVLNVGQLDKRLHHGDLTLLLPYDLSHLVLRKRVGDQVLHLRSATGTVEPRKVQAPVLETLSPRPAPSVPPLRWQPHGCFQVFGWSTT